MVKHSPTRNGAAAQKAKSLSSFCILESSFILALPWSSFGYSRGDAEGAEKIMFPILPLPLRASALSARDVFFLFSGPNFASQTASEAS